MRHIYPPRAVIFRQGEEPDFLYLIEDGIVKLSRLSTDGHQVIVGLRSQDWILGTPSVLRRDRHSVTATTLTDCTLLCLEVSSFFEMLSNSADLIQKILCMLSTEVHNHVKFMESLACMNAQRRLEKLLCRFLIPQYRKLESHAVSLQIPVLHAEIAEMLGVTPEHLSRLLKGLEGRGLIRRKGGRLIVPDPASFMVAVTNGSGRS